MNKDKDCQTLLKMLGFLHKAMENYCKILEVPNNQIVF